MTTETTDRLGGMRAAIFDMDGTLVDSMSEWRSLNVRFVRERGIVPTPEQEKELFTLSGLRAVEYYRETFGIETEYEELLKLSAAEMGRIYGAGLPLKPGARGYLQRLNARGVKCVLATATPARQALIALNRKGLVRHLDYIFSTEMFEHYKGEPEFYGELCAFIGERPEDCVMFEDGLYAVQGALAAGLGAVGITDPTNAYCRDALREACDLLIDSYDELP